MITVTAATGHRLDDRRHRVCELGSSKLAHTCAWAITALGGASP
jgi:hypothetical protein